MLPVDLPKDSFADIAVALLAETRHYADNNSRLEVLAARLAIAGLNDTTAARILADAERHAELIAAAHKLFKAMCEHEPEIRRIVISNGSPESGGILSFLRRAS